MSARSQVEVTVLHETLLISYISRRLRGFWLRSCINSGVSTNYSSGPVILWNDPELRKVLYLWLQFYYKEYKSRPANEVMHRARYGTVPNGKLPWPQEFITLRHIDIYDYQPGKLTVECLSVWLCQMFFSRLNWGYGFLGKKTIELKCHSYHIISRVHSQPDLWLLISTWVIWL